VYVRDCYLQLIDDILISLPKKNCKAFAILGTAGIGKSSFFLVVLKMLLDDPEPFGLHTRSFYFQTRKDMMWLYSHEDGSFFYVGMFQ
jgi:hypothetical protein